MAPGGWCSRGNDKARPPQAGRERGQAAGRSGKNQQGGRRRGAEYEAGHGGGPQPTAENYTGGKQGWKRPAPTSARGRRLLCFRE